MPSVTALKVQIGEREVVIDTRILQLFKLDVVVLRRHIFATLRGSSEIFRALRIAMNLQGFIRLEITLKNPCCKYVPVQQPRVFFGKSWRTLFSKSMLFSNEKYQIQYRSFNVFGVSYSKESASVYLNQ
jgi:hypothetical protein